MSLISSDIQRFTEAVVSEKPVSCDSNGKWSTEWRITVYIRVLFGLINHRNAGVLRAFNRCLDELEKKPVQFGVGSGGNVNFKVFIKAAEVLNRHFENTNSRIIKTEVLELKRRYVALKYRIELENGGVTKSEESDKNLFEWLSGTATTWRNNQSMIPSRKKITSEGLPKELTPGQQRRLRETCRYPEFIAMLKLDPVLQENFFKWVIRNRNSVQAFVEFPAMHQKLRQSLLAPRIGFCGGQILRVINESQQERKERTEHEGDLKREGEYKEFKEGGSISRDGAKDVQMLFEGRWLSILDEKKEVTFRGGNVRTIQQVFQQFTRKRNTWGRVEVLSEKLGICNWHAGKMAFYDKSTRKYNEVPLTGDWWEKLPPTKILTLSQAQNRYGRHCDGSNWGAKIMATRESLDLELAGTHSYIEVAAPGRNANGEPVYNVYSFGKHPIMAYPRKLFDFPKAIAGTHQAWISYPDVSIYQRQRQHDGHQLGELSQKDGERLMNSIKEFIQAGRDKNLAYQLFMHNCANWACEVASRAFPERKQEFFSLFATSFMMSKPVGVLGKIFTLIKKMPRWCQARFISLFLLPLGSRDGKKVVEKDGTIKTISLWHYPPFGEGKSISIPSAWFLRKEGKELPVSM